ncbi:hypothetical protein ACF0H5_006835 [Mactra antiquata]
MNLPNLHRRYSIAVPNEIPSRESTSADFKDNDLQEIPYRKEQRRMSTLPATTTTSNQRWNTFSKQRTSIDLSASQELLKNVGSQKRNSVPMACFKPSLRNMGFRVTNFIRAKNMFSRLKQKASKAQENVVSEEAFEIKEMPSAPRFASTLSAEAQYATMKGYEDVVYKTLCNMYPENAPKIRRNKTPLPGVSISIADQNKPENPKATSNRLLSLRNVLRREVTATSVTDVQSIRETTITPLPGTNEKVRTKEQKTANNLSETTTKATTESTRAKSGKHAPNKEKQLVLTYRYQRAMDLLDTLRKSQGLYPLSPRKSVQDQVEPLKEYNDWSYVWTHHFEKKAVVQSAR